MAARTAQLAAQMVTVDDAGQMRGGAAHFIVSACPTAARSSTWRCGCDHLLGQHVGLRIPKDWTD